MANFEQSLKKFLGHYEDLNRTLGPSDDGFYREFMVREGEGRLAKALGRSFVCRQTS